MEILKKNMMVGMTIATLSLSHLAGMATDVSLTDTSILPQQDKSMHVRGVVRDVSGNPLIGVSVVPSDALHLGVVTNAEGKYDVIVKKDDTTLRFSYIGFKTTLITVKPGGEYDVTMKEDIDMMDEVVVVGYGTMKKSDLTGSTVSLRNDAITSVMASNPLEALQGKSSGVAVFTDNQPGEAPTLRIRGSASINAGTDPLYVVDGFALTDGNMNDINPADIESMEILKDASATAIYGFRGANGVVMITTKKGSQGKHNISVYANMGIKMRSRLIETISGQDFIDYINAANVAQGGEKPYPNGYNGPFYDWQKGLVKSAAITEDYGLILDGMSENTRYMFSAGYYNQEGQLESQGYEKFSLHSNLEHKFNKWFSIGSNMQLTSSRQNVQTDPVLNDIFRSGWPTDQPYNEDGSYNIVQHGEVFNPFADIAATTDCVKSLRFIGNFFAQVDFTDHLNYRLNIGYDTKTSNQYQFLSSQMAKNIQAGSTSSTGMHKWASQESRLMDNILTYSNQWGGDHRMSLTGVYSWQDYKYKYSQMSGMFSNDNLGANDFSGADQASLETQSDIYSNRLISWTARGTYAYKDRYLLTATVRFDGSSRFGLDSKWGTFPSGGIAWRATEEEFLKNNKVITELKLRASYGVTGNQEIGNYQSLARLATGSSDANYSDGTGSIQGFYESIGNSKLKWESTRQLDLGFDLTLIDRICINFDYYDRQTKDLLYTVPIPDTSGYSNVLSNVGKVSNHGLELAVSADVFKNRDWRVSLGGNFTYNTNKIKRLYDGADRITIYDGTASSGISRVLEVGQPVNGVYTYHSLGIIKSQEQLDEYITMMPSLKGLVDIGSEMYEDINGDGNLTIDDTKCIGSIEPKYFYGFNVGVQYKDFKLQVYGQGAFKYASMAGSEDYYNNDTKWAVAFQNTGNYALWVDNNVKNQIGVPSVDGYANMWSATNPNGTAPAVGAKGVVLSDRTNADWSYFILKNIQMSYDFTKLVNSKYIKGLLLNVNLQNFFTSANHIGYNPENGDVSNPYGKTLMFGLNVKF